MHRFYAARRRTACRVSRKQPEQLLVSERTVEHPYGIVKLWMREIHFQMRTLENMSAEMRLYMLAYNMKRMMRILGIGQKQKFRYAFPFA